MATYYSMWYDLKEDDLWSVACASLPQCKVWPHQTLNNTLSRQLIGLSGTVSKPDFDLDKILFPSKAVAFVWGYSACKIPGSNATASTKLVTPSGVKQYSDQLYTCPSLSEINHTGTFMLDSSFTIGLELSAPWMGKAWGAEELYIGQFLLQLIPLDLSALTTTTSYSLSAANPLSSAATSGTSSSPGTQATTHTTILLQNGTTVTRTVPVSTSSQGTNSTSSSTSNPPQTTLPTLVPSISSAGTGAKQSDRTGTVVGTAVGACLAVLLVVLAGWWYYRRRRLQAVVEPYHNGEQGDAHVMAGGNNSLIPYNLPPNQRFIRDGGGILYSSRKQRPPSPISSHSDSPLMGVGHRRGSIIDSDGSHIDTPDHTNTYDTHSVTPPSLIAPQGPFSPQTIGALPAYETYMDTPLVTFRREGTNRYRNMNIGLVQGDDGVEDGQDALHKWAQERRELVPLHLERRLRSGGYDPARDPDEITEEIWLERFGVTRYELRGLREAFTG